jgi:hypothetical protein
MNEATLSLTGLSSSITVDITLEALSAKRDAIELGQSITKVTSKEEQADALAAASLLKGLERKMESTRVEVKKPALEACRRIDSIAEGYVGTIRTERQRLEALAGAYQASVEQAANELIAAELADMAKAEDMSEDAMRERTVRKNELAQVIPKPAGAQFKTFTDYLVEDALALANARPDLVEITVRRRELLGFLSIPNQPALPGITTFQNQAMHAKAS